MNIFETIGSVTRRYEPYHSQFLADALRSSIDGDDSLFRAVWQLVAKPDWEIPDCADVTAEEVIESGRVDIVITSERPIKRVVGIEVKTVDASAQEGQLRAYLEGLCKKFPNHEKQIAYLTPFNRKRAGDVADSIKSIREFDHFLRDLPSARHVSWLDIAEIPWDDNELWEQHREFVRNEISTERKLQSKRGGGRQFGTFFGEQGASHFWEELAALGIDSNKDGVRIDLASVSGDLSSFSRSLLEAFEILLKSEDVSTNACRQDAFGEDLRRHFLDSQYGDFHDALFKFANQYPYVWIQGNDNYAVRVAHRKFGSGVSLLRTRGTDEILTGQRR